jgi:hypothetical protein
MLVDPFLRICHVLLDPTQSPRPVLPYPAHRIRNALAKCGDLQLVRQRNEHAGVLGDDVALGLAEGVSVGDGCIADGEKFGHSGLPGSWSMAPPGHLISAGPCEPHHREAERKEEPVGKLVDAQPGIASLDAQPTYASHALVGRAKPDTKVEPDFRRATRRRTRKCSFRAKPKPLFARRAADEAIDVIVPQDGPQLRDVFARDGLDAQAWRHGIWASTV